MPDTSATLSIEVTTRGAATLVRMRGSAGITTSATLEREVTRLSAGTHPVLVLDLSGLESIASLSVSQLVMLQRAVRNRGGLVRIGGCGENVRGVLLRCKLDTAMPIFDTVEAAMATA